MTTYGWGLNSSGLLGVGDTTLVHSSPAAAAGSTDFLQARTMGLAGTLFIATDNTVYFAGSNTNGNFGDGTAASSATRSTPTQVPGLTSIVKVQAGDACYALDASGSLWAWGDNTYGQLAQGSFGGSKQLTPISIATGVLDFDSDGDTTIILKAAGVVQTVGNGGNGALANGGTSNANTWQTVTPGSGTVVEVVIGYANSVVRRSDGSVLAAGFNTGTANKAGQLGVTANVTSVNWITLPYTSAAHIWAGYMTTFIQKSDGTIWGMGRNERGQLGTGSVSGGASSPHVSTPTQWHVPSTWATDVPATTFQQIPLFSAVSWAFCILGTDGKVYTWGDGSGGGMGNGGTTTNNPTAASANGLTGITWVSSGGYAQFASNVVVSPSSLRRRGFAAVIG